MSDEADDPAWAVEGMEDDLVEWCAPAPLSHSEKKPEAAGATDSLWMAEKAGMAGLDKERIRAIVQLCTQGTAFAHEQKRRDDETGRKIAAAQLRLRSLSSGELAAAQRSVARRISELEASRDLSRT